MLIMNKPNIFAAVEPIPENVYEITLDLPDWRELKLQFKVKLT